ncbi:MAG: LysR family transcriptional regulator [Erysipelotrichaceae bacterium]|nr:LysR family transcriptional regulator [Erysipelotrichaceae bacterium]
MDLRLIRYFLALCEEENFTAAAKKLNITQPTLSREIQNLEAELGKQLVIRGKRKITLTDEGIYLRRQGYELLDMSEKIEFAIRNYDNDIEGDVYLGSAETALFDLLADTIVDVRRDYPRIRFHIYSGVTSDIRSRIDSGLLTFGLIFSSEYLSRYRYLDLHDQVRWGILARKDDPLSQKKAVSPEDIKHADLILSTREESSNRILNWLQAESEQLNISSYINLSSNAEFLVKKGGGYCFTIEGLNTDHDLTFIPLIPEIYQSPKIIYKKNPVFSRADKIFLSYLRANVLRRKLTPGTEAETEGFFRY